MSKYRNIQIKRFAQMFGALSNPHRAVIFLRLASCCSSDAQSCTCDELRTCVGDLGKGLNIAASTVSHHIKELNRAGLIKMERCGRTVKCCVDPNAVRELTRFFTETASEERPTTIRKRKRI